jgi:tetratricopeptide (TPR) repeat protein
MDFLLRFKEWKAKIKLKPEAPTSGFLFSAHFGSNFGFENIGLNLPITMMSCDTLKNMQKFFHFTLLFFLVQNVTAQNIPQEYQKAKSELQAKNYWEAMRLFKEFTNTDKYGKLANYAAIHFAEAALAMNQPEQAINALQPIYGKNWDNSDESHYLLAVSYFRNGQNFEALRVIQRIKGLEIKEKAFDATFEYMSKSSASFLVANLQEFKENEGYTSALALALEKQTIMSASEREALNQIKNSGVSKSGPRDLILDVVVILPFSTGSGSINSVSSTDFMFELHQGIEMGLEQLKKQGQEINLLTFDSKRDVKHLANLLKDPAILEADVIIGPIYPEETDVVSAFAEAQKIPFIHPLSNLGERFEQYQYSYLFRPSVNSLANGIISSLKKQQWGTRVAIGYSGSSRDEKLGSILESELKKSGYSVLKSQRIDAKNASSFFQSLGVKRGNTPDVDQVILLADDPAIAQATFSLMESITTSVPTLVMDSWLGFNFANFEMLEFPNFYFISNNTPKFDSEAIQQFRSDFYSQYLAFPSLNATLGYELANWVVSNATVDNGFDLRTSLDKKSFQPGKLTWGFNFQNSKNNSYSPVFKLDAGALIPLQ